MRHTGGLAFSASHTAKLLNAARKRVPLLQQLNPYHIHFVDLEQELDQHEQDMLHQLLAYPPAGADDLLRHAAYASQLVVVPRPGTISPWSSKATEIVRNCGLDKVRRLERGVLWTLFSEDALSDRDTEALYPLLHDRMTEIVLPRLDDAEESLFEHSGEAPPLITVPLRAQGRRALERADRELGLALSDDEMEYLEQNFRILGRDPTDVELMMFAQANSEHCRHKIFNADWVIDGQPMKTSLFAMIRNTHQRNPGKVLSAYEDNAAVIQGFEVERFAPGRPEGGNPPRYRYITEQNPILMKVETHNHPTAISPFPGAATGSGGEIRDEGATGRGSRPKAGLCGFSVSHLRIPEFPQPWEDNHGFPARVADALRIMLEGPIGAAAFNNEFGRPGLCGYFRNFELEVKQERRGYHKPIMLAGGLGHVRPPHLHKANFPSNTLLIVLGGPAMLIGLGGGAASSVDAGQSRFDLDFASVQRGNPEMQRRCQEVIDACTRLGSANPILSIHDVGAGGLSNALPELIHASGKGGRFELRDIPSADPGLSPMELWCNEAQERYVLALDRDSLEMFRQFCERERCPFAVVGTATLQPQLTLTDRRHASRPPPVDMPLSVLLGKPPRMTREVSRLSAPTVPLDLQLGNHQSGVDLVDAAFMVLRFPTVSDKSFLITIGDRSVGGLVVRDQMVGPWQVPVADCAVTAAGFHSREGEAMAIGERTPVALLSGPASGRLAVGEALANLAAAPIDDFSDIVLSANWMAACGHPGEDAILFDTVKAVGLELCPQLGLSIPVGKDSLSMKTVWEDRGERKSVTAPLSLIVSAFARVSEVERCLTPQLQAGDTALLLVDLGRKKNRLGGSVLAQVYNRLGDTPPDLERVDDLKSFFLAIQTLNRQGRLLAYHDRSDGGLFVTLCEMAFAGHRGLDVILDALGPDPLATLFSEELGAVLQVRRKEAHDILLYFVQHTSLAGHIHLIGYPNNNDILNFQHQRRTLLALPREELHRAWSETSYHLQRLRDDPACAKEAYDALLDSRDPGLGVRATFEPGAAPSPGKARPRVAILREQGVNGQVEMAAAFERAGFECVDLHMSDLLEGRATLKDFQGLAACGGFSYGDVLGAGGGWAKTIRFHARAFDEFSAFFQREDNFTLGVCNGCQMLAQLKDLIPGAEHWPLFVRNRSEQFEARLVMVEIPESPSILTRGMAGSRLPVVVAHGEGRADFSGLPGAEQPVLSDKLVTLRYLDNQGRVTQRYPFNPNGSPQGITGLTTPDGRVTIMMPHPERVFLRRQYSWLPPEWSHEEGPWMQLFHNARAWLN